MSIMPGLVCLRPDGEVCGHEEKEHYFPHSLINEAYCFQCWDGRSLMGPYVHAYNPHLWSGAGWLLVKPEEARP